MNCKDCCQDCQRIGCNIEVNCTGHIAKPKTNADRIRSMTDEELAWFYAEKIASCYGCESSTASDCAKCWLNWLKQECES